MIPMFLANCWVGTKKKNAFTLPAVVADTQLLPGEVAVAVVGAAAVVPAVGDVTGLAFPVLVTFTVHSASDRVPRSALPMARAVIGTRVDPVQRNISTLSCRLHYLGHMGAFIWELGEINKYLLHVGRVEKHKGIKWFGTEKELLRRSLIVAVGLKTAEHLSCLPFCYWRKYSARLYSASCWSSKAVSWYSRVKYLKSCQVVGSITEKV